MVETKGTPEPGSKPDQPAPRAESSLPTSVEFDFVSFLIAGFVVTVVATGLLFGYRYLIVERTLSEQKQEIAGLEQELADPELVEIEKKAQAISGGIDKIRPILDEKIRFAELFWTLRKVTEKNVRWNSFGLNETRQLSLTGDAAGWGNIAVQLAAMKQDQHFSNVQLTSATLGQGATNFVIQFSVTADVVAEALVPPSDATGN